MTENYALSVFKSNPDLADRLREQIAYIQKAKGGLSNAAKEYSSKYQQEVNEGTKKMKILLEYGKKQGLSEEEILSSQTTFCPTVRTPILNMLFFLLREYPDANNINFNRLMEDIDKSPELLIEEQNKKFGSLQHESEAEQSAESAPSLDEFIYGEMTHEAYQTIKKLKRLSQSPNENEAFVAYRKCVELCKKYNLEFDKVRV